jgi:hypothetical protein
MVSSSSSVGGSSASYTNPLVSSNSRNTSPTSGTSGGPSVQPPAKTFKKF